VKASDFIKQPLVWKPHPVKPYYFTHFKTDALLLKRDDVSGKSFYTLSHRLELVKLDHLPKKWKIDQPAAAEQKRKS
jgi:hypothetical protein